MAWGGGTYYITRVNQEKNVYGCGSLLGLQLPPLPIAFCNAFTGFALLDFFKSIADYLNYSQKHYGQPYAATIIIL